MHATLRYANANADANTGADAPSRGRALASAGGYSRRRTNA